MEKNLMIESLLYAKRMGNPSFQRALQENGQEH